MERDNLHELLNVLETIRAEKYPNIPSQVVNDIVATQYDNQSLKDRVQGKQKTTQIIMQFLNASTQEDER